MPASCTHIHWRTGLKTHLGMALSKQEIPGVLRHVDGSEGMAYNFPLTEGTKTLKTINGVQRTRACVLRGSVAERSERNSDRIW